MDAPARASDRGRLDGDVRTRRAGGRLRVAVVAEAIAFRGDCSATRRGIAGGTAAMRSTREKAMQPPMRLPPIRQGKTGLYRYPQSAMRRYYRDSGLPNSI